MLWPVRPSVECFQSGIWGQYNAMVVQERSARERRSRPQNGVVRANSAPAAALNGITAVCQSITCGASKFGQ